MNNIRVNKNEILLSRNKPADAPTDGLSLSAVPSAAEIKKIWSTQKLDDGTLMITGYK